MELIAAHWFRISIVFLVTLNSAFLVGCSNTSPKASEPRSAPTYSPSTTPNAVAIEQRSVSQDNMSKIRDKFLLHYNNANFSAAYSQIAPVSAAARKNSNIATWKQTFINTGDIILIQRVAAYAKDRDLFEYISAETGYSSNICIYSMWEAAQRDWKNVVAWAECYASKQLQRKACTHFQVQLERHTPNISIPLGEPSGKCSR